MIKVIIFDLDGLLIDSQPLQYKAYNQVFSQHGYPITPAQWHEWIHNSYSAKKWIQKYHLPVDPLAIRAEKKKIYDQLIRDELTLKPGAIELVNTLHKDYRLCVASASRIESIELVLNKFHLTEKFERLVSDTEMVRGKPFPDIFLEAAQAMNAATEECLVIEDSIAGVRAAKAAHMKCIIRPDTFAHIARSEFVGADKIVDNLSEITLALIMQFN